MPFFLTKSKQKKIEKIPDFQSAVTVAVLERTIARQRRVLASHGLSIGRYDPDIDSELERSVMALGHEERLQALEEKIFGSLAVGDGDGDISARIALVEGEVSAREAAEKAMILGRLKAGLALGAQAERERRVAEERLLAMESGVRSAIAKAKTTVAKLHRSMGLPARAKDALQPLVSIAEDGVSPQQVLAVAMDALCEAAVQCSLHEIDGMYEEDTAGRLVTVLRSALAEREMKIRELEGSLADARDGRDRVFLAASQAAIEEQVRILSSVSSPASSPATSRTSPSATSTATFRTARTAVSATSPAHGSGNSDTHHRPSSSPSPPPPSTLESQARILIDYLHRQTAVLASVLGGPQPHEASSPAPAVASTVLSRHMSAVTSLLTRLADPVGEREREARALDDTAVILQRHLFEQCEDLSFRLQVSCPVSRDSSAGSLVVAHLGLASRAAIDLDRALEMDARLTDRERRVRELEAALETARGGHDSENDGEDENEERLKKVEEVADQLFSLQSALLRLKATEEKYADLSVSHTIRGQ